MKNRIYNIYESSDVNCLIEIAYVEADNTIDALKIWYSIQHPSSYRHKYSYSAVENKQRKDLLGYLN